MKRLAILGATGSIGRQTLEVVRAFPQRFRVVALAAGRNVELLGEQVRQFQPKFVSLESGTIDTSGIKFLSLEEIASHPEVDLVVVATSGKAGLEPTLAAIGAGKNVALANKEVLVMAGEIVTSEARRQRVEILPIDSEHSAIWQCLRGEQKGHISQLILTASGGPFGHHSPEQLQGVTPQEALEHPTWQMGEKVSIDSATLMNKGMEVIEAHWLFDIPFPNISVVIHPESIVHSMVEFVDGSIKAQLSPPDMRLPIQYALSYPERWLSPFPLEVELEKIGCLTFDPMDSEKFPCFKLAVEAGEMGGTYPAVLSAADEVAVKLFLRGQIGFLDIARVVEKTLSQHQGIAHPSLEDILAADAWARGVAKNEALGR